MLKLNMKNGQILKRLKPGHCFLIKAHYGQIHGPFIALYDTFHFYSRRFHIDEGYSYHRQNTGNNYLVIGVHSSNVFVLSFVEYKIKTRRSEKFGFQLDEFKDLSIIQQKLNKKYSEEVLSNAKSGFHIPKNFKPLLREPLRLDPVQFQHFVGLD